MKKEIGNMAPKDDGKGSNNWTTPGLGASKQASELLKGNPVKTGTKIEAKSKSDIEKQQEREDIIRSNDPSLSEKDVKIAAEGLEQLEVAIAFGNWPGSGFMTVKGAGETAVERWSRDFVPVVNMIVQIAKQ